MLEQFEQVMHMFEKTTAENARLTCQVCRLTAENERLREALAKEIDPIDELAEDVARHCAVECL